jgi:hypoxanthine phosphoribosyltransferase
MFREPSTQLCYNRFMEEARETWNSIRQKTLALSEQIANGQHQEFTRLAMIPMGGLYVAAILSRTLGFRGDHVLSLWA